jgi:regulator of sirC expression with transglutaminase-like and TPR domain
MILIRTLTNLKGTYLRGEDFGRAVRVIERLRQLVPDDALQQRDLGVCLLRTEQPGRAIDHLTAYLKACPSVDDAGAVQKMLRQAQGLVARWN